MSDRALNITIFLLVCAAVVMAARVEGKIKRRMSGDSNVDIVATREGTTREGLAERTAYGLMTGYDVFVALPSDDLKGKWVELECESGTRAIVPVGDIGPWNGAEGCNDKYWETADRPQSESGIDKRGRKTNSAGIDLSQKLWEMLGLKGGSTVVKWKFAPTPQKKMPIIIYPDGRKTEYVNSRP